MTKVTHSTINHRELERAATAALSLSERAKKYVVDDLSAAVLIGRPLANILERLESNGTLSATALKYLRDNGLAALHDYAAGTISFADFGDAARLEYDTRHLATAAQHIKDEEQRLKEEAAQKLLDDARQAEQKLAQERILAARLAYDRDPRNIAKAKQLSLREEYDLLGFIEQTYFLRLMQILHRVDAGFRLSEEELIWLSTDAERYFTQELRAGYHRNEARFHADEFRKTGDPWCAVNASSHYRKCRAAAVADDMLAGIDVDRLRDRKLQSALCTTCGGVKRDLSQWDEALDLGAKAHDLTPQDFRPCTLLGAVNIEIGAYELGRYWYNEAEARGASIKAIDDELRSIFLRADPARRAALRAHLLDVDPIRYRWVERLSAEKAGPRR